MAASKAKSWHTTKLTCKEKLKFHISNIDLNFSFDVTFKFSGQKTLYKIKIFQYTKETKNKNQGPSRDDSLKFKVMGRLHTVCTTLGNDSLRPVW